MPRLTKIEPDTASRLLSEDECYYSGEYQSHGGYQAGEYNQLISNLKIPVPVPAHRIRWKNAAIQRCAEILQEGISGDALPTITFVPVPGSKPLGHPEYDDRMVRVLDAYGAKVGGIDVRQAVLTAVTRDSQHGSGSRLSIDELLSTLLLNTPAFSVPFRPTVVIFDDVFTLGTSFRAMKVLLEKAPGVQRVVGVSIARTVWPVPDFSKFFGVIGDS